MFFTTLHKFKLHNLISWTFTFKMKQIVQLYVNFKQRYLKYTKFKT